MKRKQEVDDLHTLIDKIKKYIDTNKEKLIKDNGEMEKRIFEIQVINNTKLRETIEYKYNNHMLPRRSFSTSFIHSENNMNDSPTPQLLPG